MEMRNKSKQLNPIVGPAKTLNNASNIDKEVFGVSVIATTLVLVAVRIVQSERIRSTEPIKWLNATFGDLTTPLLVLPPLLLLGVGIAWASPRFYDKRWLRCFCALLALGLLIVASSQEDPIPSQLGAWTGFGFGPTIATLVFSLLILFQPKAFVQKTSHKKLVSMFNLFIPIAVLILYSLVYIQPPNGLINLGDTTYHVLDELLAPMLGSFPISDYSPQYSGMLGWLLFPLKFLSLSGETTMLVVIAICNIFNLLIPILVFLIVIGVFPKLPKLITLASFVVIWGVSGTSRGGSVQLREFAHFGRFVPILFAIWMIVRTLNSRAFSQQKYALVAGFVGALVILGSPDYGLSFMIAFLLSLSLAIYRNWIASRIRHLFLVGTITGITSYCFVLVLAGKMPSTKSWIGLRSGVRSLYGGGSLDVFGPHLIVMAIAVTSIALGIHSAHGNTITKQEITFRVIILSLGLWILALLIRYLLSPHPIGLPPLFIPSFVAFILILGHFEISGYFRSRPSDRLTILPLLFISALPVAAIWHFPNPQDELRRISGQYVNTTNWSSTPGRVSDGWSPSALRIYDDFINNTSTLAREIQSNDSSIGYFGIFGNTVELLTGVSNVLGIAAPESLRFGTSQEKLACVPVDSQRPQFVIVYLSSFPCSHYREKSKYLQDKFVVYERVIFSTTYP